MLKRSFLYFIGYIKLRIRSEDAAVLKENLFNAKLPVIFGRTHRRKGKKYNNIIVRRVDAPYFYETADGAGVEYTVLCRRGLPFLYKRFSHRVGLAVGFVILLAALFISDDFVWEINVTGNESVSKEEIVEQLDKLGFRCGTYYRNVDFDVLHNRFLHDSDDIAWIAVNMRGSIANVEVREYIAGGDDKKTPPANIIAACGGKITQVSAFSGRSAVKIGDVVEPGQLLISGVVEYEQSDTKYLRAKGEVYAEIERNISVSIPLVMTVLRDDGDKISEYGIKLFSHEIFFGFGGRIDGTLYDTIIKYDEITIFNTVKLPMQLITATHTHKVEQTETLTETAAAALAYSEYKRMFADACRDVTLLSYDMSGQMSLDGSAYEIECVIRCIADIAKTLEFEIN